jgi:hypothetical protein
VGYYSRAGSRHLSDYSIWKRDVGDEACWRQGIPSLASCFATAVEALRDAKVQRL